MGIEMDQQKLSEIRRRFLRRSYWAFGLPFLLLTTVVFFKEFSGPPVVLLIFYVITMISAVFGVYLWSHSMWAIFGESVLKSLEHSMRQKEKLESRNANGEHENGEL